MRISDDKWKILIVTNNFIKPENYINDSEFNPNNWQVFNVSNTNRMSSSKFNIINALDIPNYMFKGKSWAESEAIYNIYKLDLFREYEYLGFIHQDFNLINTDNKSTDITRQIRNGLEHSNWISFQRYTIKEMFQYTNMLIDERYPEVIFYDNKQNLECPIFAFPFIINTIRNNTIYDMNVNNIDLQRTVTSCSAFVTKRRYILQIGKLMDIMLKEYNIEYINEHCPKRYIGNLFERMIMFYSYSFFPTIIPLHHDYITTREN